MSVNSSDNFCIFLIQLNDSESLKKFPSKSCPLRYGTTKIQEDSLSLFQTGLREYIGIYNVKTKGSNQHEWAITGLSVSASKIVTIPSVSRNNSVSCCLLLSCV